MIEKEYEKKYLLSESSYEKLLSDYTRFQLGMPFIQINHYYDSNNLSLYHKHETLRIRHKDNSLILEYKFNKKHIEGVRICDEYKKTVNDVPEILTFNNIEYKNMGSLVTLRTNFLVNDCKISIDKNYYLGFIDFEFELEANSITQLQNLFDEFEFNMNDGKYSRYIKKLIDL